MRGFQVLSAAEQVSNHLKEELLRGTWVGLMPGEDRLMALLGIGRNTVGQALSILVADGYLKNQGPGLQRKITLPENRPGQALGVGILLYDPPDLELARTNHLRQRLLDAGHIPSIASKTLESLKMDPDRVAQFVKDTPYDAWIVCSAPSDILDWFSQQAIPAFALFGSLAKTPIAGATPCKLPRVMDLMQELIDMGHKRIVNITRKERIIPKLGGFEEAFIEKLESCGIPTSGFNLPIWDPRPQKLHRQLDSLFQHTPPTAIYISEHQLFIAVQHYLANKGIKTPRDISLICGEPHISFPWIDPSPSHFDWDMNRIVQCAIRWVNNVAKGKKDIKQTQISVKLVKGATIGPPKK